MSRVLSSFCLLTRPSNTLTLGESASDVVAPGSLSRCFCLANHQLKHSGNTHQKSLFSLGKMLISVLLLSDTVQDVTIPINKESLSTILSTKQGSSSRCASTDSFFKNLQATTNIDITTMRLKSQSSTTHLETTWNASSTSPADTQAHQCERSSRSSALRAMPATSFC